ncbi:MULTISPECIES: hypothetical protein [Novosphingobium]|uniref:hypothetical protein n=1 Tax=Novosphingobium TaxID=165696 RepID=UPI000D6DD0ED|nr:MULTISPECIES: hypothetical protein [Novosphingobium]
MAAAKPLASLSSSLLARKGAARPAMRPQLALGGDDAASLLSVNGAAAPALTRADLALEDLGWNDFGMDQTSDPHDPADALASEAPCEKPVVVRQQEALARAIAPFEPSAAQAPRSKGGKVIRSALAEGRKAAFTLRLDSYRHLRLRLASTLADRSAQAVVTEALDRYLADLPEIEDLARRATARK